MKQVISAIERQISIESARLKLRESMIANQDEVLFNEPLPQSNPQYLEELKKSLSILKYLDTPIEDWCLEEGYIEMPEELQPLFNNLGNQLMFHTHADKDQHETVCSMVWIAQKFFHENMSIYGLPNNNNQVLP